MRWLLRRRLPLAATVAALVQGIALAMGAEQVPLRMLTDPGWISPAIVAFMLTYLGISALIGLVLCIGRLTAWARPALAGLATPPFTLIAQRVGAPALSGPDWQADGRFTRLSPQPFGWRRGAMASPRLHQLLVAGLLGAVVLLVGVSHLGERSGAWATGRPLRENESKTADGHVVWLDGQPVQEDSATFITGFEVMTGRLPAAEITGYARSGRTAYPFLVSVLSPVAVVLGSVYAAFMLTNLLLWWGGALAVYDLTRRASGSIWTGIVAGVFVATGIGFSFAVGSAMSVVAAYGAVPIVLWVMDRLGVLTARSRLGDDVLTGCLAAGAGLLNSLAPFFLCFAGCYYLGRSELRRLLLWGGVVVFLGQAWGLWLSWAGRPPAEQAGLGNVRITLAMTAGLLLLVVLTRLPRRWGERAVAVAVLGATAGLALLSLVAPGRLMAGVTLAMGGLHLPEYISGQLLPRFFSRDTQGWGAIFEGLRQGAFDLDLVAAFPGPLLVLALVGLPRLPSRWRDWVLAVVVSAGLTAFTMDTIIGFPHPRLVYLAYPGICLLAAHGVSNLCRLVEWAGRRLPGLPPGYVRAAAVCLAIAIVVVVAVPGQASLWGDASYDLFFHYRGPG